jgi:hypothetical protein
MALIALKVILTPVLIGVASIAAGRWGAMIGGWVVSLPMISGSVALFVALGEGTSFAALTAKASLVGLLAVVGYCVAYAAVARRVAWPVAILVALASWAAVAIAIRPLASFSDLVSLVLLGLAVVLSLRLLPNAHLPVSRTPAGWDVALRMGLGTIAVLAVTALAPLVGPTSSGLLATIPITTSVLATGTHAREGVDRLIGLLRGLLTGLLATAGFLALLSLTLVPFGVVGSFGVALLAVLALQAIALRRIARSSGGTRPIP